MISQSASWNEIAHLAWTRPCAAVPSQGRGGISCACMIGPHQTPSVQLVLFQQFSRPSLVSCRACFTKILYAKESLRKLLMASSQYQT